MKQACYQLRLQGMGSKEAERALLPELPSQLQPAREASPTAEITGLLALSHSVFRIKRKGL